MTTRYQSGYQPNFNVRPGSVRRWLSRGLALVLAGLLVSCGGGGDQPRGSRSPERGPQVVEVATPIAIAELAPGLDDYRPQVSILSPQPDQVLDTDSVTVRLQSRDLPIYKEEVSGLGPHLHLMLDNQAYQEIYEPTAAIDLTDLVPGTHTLRVYATRPWGESFKNEGAYAQVTFHVLTRTPRQQPDPSLPLLTYNQPQGLYGAEPILLDFQLSNAPLHVVAREDTTDEIRDWKIRCTVNGQVFVFDDWRPIYLQGFKRGQNWVKLEFLDETGEPIDNEFNTTVRLIDYQPGGDDPLAQLIRGELPPDVAPKIVDPTYEPPAPEPELEPEPEPQELEDEGAPIAPSAPTTDPGSAEVTPSADAESPERLDDVAPADDTQSEELAAPEQPSPEPESVPAAETAPEPEPENEEAAIAPAESPESPQPAPAPTVPAPAARKASPAADPTPAAPAPSAPNQAVAPSATSEPTDTSDRPTPPSMTKAAGEDADAAGSPAEPASPAPLANPEDDLPAIAPAPSDQPDSTRADPATTAAPEDTVRTKVRDRMSAVLDRVRRRTQARPTPTEEAEPEQNLENLPTPETLPPPAPDWFQTPPSADPEAVPAVEPTSTVPETEVERLETSNEAIEKLTPSDSPEPEPIAAPMAKP